MLGCACPQGSRLPWEPLHGWGEGGWEGLGQGEAVGPRAGAEQKAKPSCRRGVEVLCSSHALLPRPWHFGEASDPAAHYGPFPLWLLTQGPCGSCWTFSTTGCLESAIAIATGKLLSLVRDFPFLWTDGKSCLQLSTGAASGGSPLLSGTAASCLFQVRYTSLRAAVAGTPSPADPLQLFASQAELLREVRGSVAGSCLCLRLCLLPSPLGVRVSCCHRLRQSPFRSSVFLWVKCILEGPEAAGSLLPGAGEVS